MDMKIQDKLFAVVVFFVTLCRLEEAPTRLMRTHERGDADSAGSTLRTIMVVIVVTAVVAAIGAAIRSAGGRAADCITNAGC